MGKVLSLSMEPQECTEWCWAATVLATCRCYQDPGPSSQEELAAMVLSIPDSGCGCREDPDAPCNCPKNISFVLSTVNDHGRDGPGGCGTLSFDDVKAEIDAGHPVAVDVVLDPPGATGHAIVIYGYTDDRMVFVADPMHAGDKITVGFDDFVSGLNTDHGAWRSAYRTKGTGE